jgi:cytosine/adenosine deaminase-related metal-dependent hydrolase
MPTPHRKDDVTRGSLHKRASDANRRSGSLAPGQDSHLNTCTANAPEFRRQHSFYIGDPIHGRGGAQIDRVIPLNTNREILVVAAVRIQSQAPPNDYTRA